MNNLNLVLIHYYYLTSRQTFAVEKVVKEGQKGLNLLLNKRTAKQEKDLFELPEIVDDKVEEESPESSDSETDVILKQLGLDQVSDVHQVDVKSEKFSTLPKTVQVVRMIMMMIVVVITMIRLLC